MSRRVLKDSPRGPSPFRARALENRALGTPSAGLAGAVLPALRFAHVGSYAASGLPDQATVLVMAGVPTSQAQL
jgi:hypothetical protein